MSLENNTSQPSVRYCADKMNAKYIHGRPEPELVPSRFQSRAAAQFAGKRALQEFLKALAREELQGR